jgi:hypothetical protein
MYQQCKDQLLLRRISSVNKSILALFVAVFAFNAFLSDPNPTHVNDVAIKFPE